LRAAAEHEIVGQTELESGDVTRLEGPLTFCRVVVVIVLGAGCGQPNITNPSGTCGTRSDGGRAGYHVPADSDTWVPDCQNILLREYWRVFTQDGKTAYVIPRPDGAPELKPICSDPQNDLRALVDRYQLCATAQTPEQAAIVNHIELSDALRITHFLHTQLKFVMTPGGLGIQPFPLPSDVIDACALAGHVNSTALEAICQSERDSLRNGIEPALPFTGLGGAELASRLNELYGIP
jgi:hypothetical protein